MNIGTASFVFFEKGEKTYLINIAHDIFFASDNRRFHFSRLQSTPYLRLVPTYLGVAVSGCRALLQIHTF